MKSNFRSRLLLLSLLALCASSAWAAGKGNEGNPGVIPPDAQPNGKSYGEWSAAWWKWV